MLESLFLFTSPTHTYAHTYTHAHAHTHTHTNTHTRAHTHAHAHSHTHTHTRKHKLTGGNWMVLQQTACRVHLYVDTQELFGQCATYTSALPFLTLVARARQGRGGGESP